MAEELELQAYPEGSKYPIRRNLPETNDYGSLYPKSSGLIFQGFGAQRPSYIELLGHFEP